MNLSQSTRLLIPHLKRSHRFTLGGQEYVLAMMSFTFYRTYNILLYTVERAGDEEYWVMCEEQPDIEVDASQAKTTFDDLSTRLPGCVLELLL